MSLTLLLLAVSLTAQEPLTRLLRQPDIHGDKVAFVYGGDIWVADSKGGTARRLTSDEGTEYFPKFSPDGKWIAFCGEYSGSRQVFVISVDGGQPRQLTYYNDVGALPPRGGIDNRVLGWSPDGRNILFQPHRLPWGDRMPRHYVIPAAGGMETPLAIPEGSAGMFSPDGTKLVYTPIEREFRTWKRYRGGRAQDVWIYDLKANRSERLTDNPATDNQPMWIGNSIYFTSDREGGKLNLYSYDLQTRQTRKITNHSDYDVLWPSTDRTQIIYECGGYLWRYDTATGKDERIPLHVFGDYRATVPSFRNVKQNISNLAISPTGARALFTARGDVFTVPAKNGEIRNLTQTSGVREMAATWSPDGRWIAYLSDRTGDEYELFLRSADGSGEERQLTSGGKAWKFDPIFSPDSKRIAFADKDHILHMVDVASGKMTDVDHSDYDDIGSYHWSPDSRWIAYSKSGATQYHTIYVYSIGDAKSYALTSGMTDDDEPVFDPKGRYLYFTSNRDFNLTFSAFEFNYVYTNPTRIYVGVLAADGPALFLPESDEEKVAADKSQPSSLDQEKEAKQSAPKPADDDAAKGKGNAASTAVNVRIDVAGFERRVRAIPGPSDRYSTLAATKDGVLYIVGTGAKAQLRIYNIDDKKEEAILDGVTSYEISASGEKFVYHAGDDYGIAAVKPAQKNEPLDLATMQMKVDPRAEWTQEFNDAWRIYRDWFYDPEMHGVDWKAMRERYGQLVPFIAHRTDLDFILGELIGEVNSGHAYVESTDEWRVPRIDNGLLGAEIASDPSGYFRITHIFPGENWQEAFRSPLTEPGVKVHEGDFILAVDGTSTKGVPNFYQLLESKANRVVTLRVSGSADGSGARDERVRTISKETNVRYLDWVKSRREYVEKASGGRIGYIHMPNTAVEGNRELFKYFYPQAGKEALIIDDRYNGGGFIPDRMIELLDRPLLNYWTRRNVKPQSTPAYANNGPKVCLINGYSSSGGDAFPYYFRKRGLGKLIGTRTWGGLIGISSNPGLMDGGGVDAPAFRFLDTEGKWAVEGVGVSPDIEVIDRPEEVAAGHDPSLEAAVKELLAELAKTPARQVTAPAPPSGIGH
jgi:tricorn protease